MKKKFGLIIQGPLMSIGREGRHAHITKTTLRGEGAFINYDCRENISKIIQDFGDLFNVIIISTWQNELKSEDQWPEAIIVAPPDPGEIRRKSYLYRGINKHRQFIGIKAGLEEMGKNNSIDYVVRIRTDQYLDVRGLINSFLEQIPRAKSNSTDIIGVPLTRPDDYMTHDLYFVAKLQTLKKLCDAVLAHNAHEFNSCVHRDMLLKHAYVNYRDTLRVNPWSYFPHWPPLGASAETKKIFAFMYEQIFVPLSPEVYKTVVARGSLQSKEHIDEQYLVQAIKKNIFNIPALISIDWEQYFNFREKITGKVVSFKDLILAQTGLLTWNIFQQVRKLANKIKMTGLIKKIYQKLFIS